MPLSEPDEIVDLNVGTIRVFSTHRDFVTQAYYAEAVRHEEAGLYYAFGDFVRDAILDYAEKRST